MRGRHHAPREVWDAGGVGEGGGPGDQHGLPAAYWDLPQIPRVSKRHHQKHQKGTVSLPPQPNAHMHRHLLLKGSLKPQFLTDMWMCNVITRCVYY